MGIQYTYHMINVGKRAIHEKHPSWSLYSNVKETMNRQTHSLMSNMMLVEETMNRHTDAQSNF